MTSELHCRKLERMYNSAPCNAYYSPTLKISNGQAEIIIPVQDKFFHAAGATHGSVYFKAMDDAAFFAVNSLVTDVFVLTVSFHIHLLRPVSSGKIRGIGKAFFKSKQLFGGEASLFDDKDREIARGSGTFARSKVKLTDEIGYI
ncbi:MAG: hotdog fold thioesterase [Calditrichae bacterium]|nr:hotdog fold thioesterase [Calditrichia bacterium]